MTRAMRAIVACAVCADTQLRMPGLADGVVPETDNLQDWVCRSGHRTTPLEFVDPADYEAFRQGLQ